MTANSIINTISSFASFIGSVLGGVLYSTYGLKSVLWVCMVCFILSAVMEMFIYIPFQKQVFDSSILKTAQKDFSESICFIRKKKPVIGKTLLAICGINLFLSSMIIVALLYLVTEVFNLTEVQANRLYGFAEGALAAGGLAGGICAGVFANDVFYPNGNSTEFNGKGDCVILMVSMCTQPLGNALYGILFEICRGTEYIVVLFSGVVSLMIAIGTKNVFKRLFM